MNQCIVISAACIVISAANTYFTSLSPSPPPSHRTSHGQGLSISLEQWYMVFSLLSAATSSAAGRSYVWDCICYLIDQDLVNDINFTPCRHLVLRFLQGSAVIIPSFLTHTHTHTHTPCLLFSGCLVLCSHHRRHHTMPCHAILLYSVSSYLT